MVMDGSGLAQGLLLSDVTSHHCLSDQQAEVDNRDQIHRPVRHDKIILDSTNTDSVFASDVSTCGSESDSEGEDRLIEPTYAAHNCHSTRPSSSVLGEAVIQTIELQSQKRKPSSVNHEQSTLIIPSKKAKIGGKGLGRPMCSGACPSDKSHLPAEIWHRIFTFVPPKALGNLLCANKLFNAYLDPLSSFQSSFPVSHFQSHIPPLKPDAIWQASRRRYFLRKMPIPLKGRTELDMWRLACARRCQICGQAKPFMPSSSSDQWRCGPGSDGIRTVWVFGLTSCATCLGKGTMKEIDIILSPSIPSILMPALPFVLITSDMHIVPSVMLQSGQTPPGLQVIKIFHSDSIEKLRQEFLSVKEMGEATVEEWLKGLEDRGKEHLNDAYRWEKWECSGGALQMRNTLSLNCLENQPATTNGDLIHLETSLSTSSMHLHPKPKVYQGASDQDMTVADIPNALSRDELLSHNDSHTNPRTRTREEALELKAARRAEIERRALGLEPPLPAHVLAHVPAFRAAIQITAPLDENAWSLLKPRLLAQRANAERQEQREKETATNPKGTRDRLAQRRNAEGTSIEAKQLIDKDWDDVQGPLRAQISAYADEVIHGGWNDGRKVNRESSLQFAAEVLLYVRRKFYKKIAEDTASALRAGRQPVHDTLEGPFTRKLTLENMKWLFDVKIKSHTESYRKELFYCNGCEGNFKVYGLEGVIQHYAAKHTSSLSLGSVVVHWRAEWPEIPPFHPEPRSFKALHTQQPSQLYKASSSQNSARLPQPSHHHYPPNAAPNSYHPPLYFNVSRTEYGHHSYGDQFTQPPLDQARYGPGDSCAVPQHTYGQPYPPYLPPNVVSYHQPGGEHPVSRGYYSNSVVPAPSLCPPLGGAQYHANYTAQQDHSHFGLYADRIRIQLEDIARNSRELWTATTGLRELPGNIRVYVVLHHVVNKFRSRFLESPPLSLFIEGLSNNKEMRPVRNVNGLMCKACKLGLDHHVPADQMKKTFSLPQLVNHFQKQHVEQPKTIDAPSLDWSVDMVYIPDLSMLSKLQSFSNMDNQKFALIYNALPPINHPTGSSQSFPTVTQGSWSVQSPYYGASEEMTYATPSPNPGNQASPGQSSHRRDAGSQNLDQSDSTMINPDSIREQNTRPCHHSSQIVHSKRLSSSQAVPKHGDANQISPDTWPSGEAKSRKRKEYSNTLGQSSKPRKNGGKPLSGGPKAGEPNAEDSIAEKEERRQEEEIHAMWAADRRETARLVSTTKAQVEGNMLGHQVETLVPKADAKRDHDIRATQHSPLLTIAAQPQIYPPPLLAKENEEIDLMAGLESELDRQQASSNLISYRTRPRSTMTCDGQRVYDRQRSTPWQTFITEGHTNDRHRSRSPIPLRYESKPASEQYRERSPGSRHAAPVYRLKQAPIYADDVSYRRNPRQDYYEIRVDQPCQHQYPPEYVERYEIVKVHDSRGEYFIRRPILHEQETTYFTYHDERPAYQGPCRAQEIHSHQITYNVASSRQPVSHATGLPAAMGRSPIYESLSRNDPAALEEYDPRFPATQPSLDTSGRVGYD
ncbi:hypothetical protein F5X96DRAFT_642622 [Biscogniauxia mediterranea]|nr:hypothetical protein F5X96DRAFT_642622 [Biscogniauxia mediterranea]